MTSCILGIGEHRCEHKCRRPWHVGIYSRNHFCVLVSLMFSTLGKWQECFQHVRLACGVRIKDMCRNVQVYVHMIEEGCMWAGEGDSDVDVICSTRCWLRVGRCGSSAIRCWVLSMRLQWVAKPCWICSRPTTPTGRCQLLVVGQLPGSPLAGAVWKVGYVGPVRSSDPPFAEPTLISTRCCLCKGQGTDTPKLLVVSSLPNQMQ